MTESVLAEFIRYEADDRTRRDLLAAIERVGRGQIQLETNTFTVRLDGESSTVTVDDELDVTRESTCGLDEFRQLLMDLS